MNSDAMNICAQVCVNVFSFLLDVNLGVELLPRVCISFRDGCSTVLSLLPLPLLPLASFRHHMPSVLCLLSVSKHKNLILFTDTLTDYTENDYMLFFAEFTFKTLS